MSNPDIPKIVALVPMRHSSERVPGKNYRELDGRPLYQHIVSTLLACETIQSVVVDTDSPVVKEGLAVSFPEVGIIDRPPHLTDGHIPMNEILLHDVSQIDSEYFVQTHTTNPFLSAKTIDAAIRSFFSSGAHDSLFTVTALHTRLWTEDGRPLNHDPAVLQRTQDMTPVLEENSCLYLFGRQTLEERRNRIGERPMLYAIDASESWDIDTESDWAVASALSAQHAGD